MKRKILLKKTRLKHRVQRTELHVRILIEDLWYIMNLNDTGQKPLSGGVGQVVKGHQVVLRSNSCSIRYLRSKKKKRHNIKFHEGKFHKDFNA